MDQERRKRTRAPININVGILLNGEVIQLQTLNISLTGILCISDPLFRKDDPCKVIITLNNNFPIAIDSKILRIGQKETAISFVSMDEESFAHLRKLMHLNIGDADRIDEELRYPAFD